MWCSGNIPWYFMGIRNVQLYNPLTNWVYKWVSTSLLTSVTCFTSYIVPYYTHFLCKLQFVFSLMISRLSRLRPKKPCCRNPTNRDPTWSSCAATAHSRASQQHPSPATNSKVLGRKPGRVWDFPSVAASTFKKTSKLPVDLGETAKQFGLGRITPGRMYGQYSLYLLILYVYSYPYLNVFVSLCIKVYRPQ